MKRIYLYILISLLLGCSDYERKESHCRKRINEFIKAANKMDLDCLMGFSISTRGELENGDKYIRGCFLSYRPKDSIGDIVLPSFQITDKVKSYALDSTISLKFVKELGLNEKNHLKYTKERIDCIRETFLKLHIYGAMSQAKLGEFIEFEIEHKCSIWYKKDGAYLNDTFQELFANAKKIKDNWYILDHLKHTKVLDSIPDYFIENGDTIGLEFPSGYKDENRQNSKK